MAKRDRSRESSGEARRRRPAVGRFVFLGLFLVFVLAPLYWMFITSIKPSDDYLAVPPVWFPAKPTLVHYTAALFAYRGLHGLDQQPDRLDLPRPLLSALLGTMMAYSLARFNTGGKHLSLLGAVAALPAADRHRAADLPDLSRTSDCTTRTSASSSPTRSSRCR